MRLISKLLQSKYTPLKGKQKERLGLEVEYGVEVLIFSRFGII